MHDDNFSKESSVQLVDLSGYYKKEEVEKYIADKISENNIVVKAETGAWIDDHQKQLTEILGKIPLMEIRDEEVFDKCFDM